MAAQIRVRGNASRSAGAKRKGRKGAPRWWVVWVRRGREFVRGMVPTIEISDRLKREILGIALVLFALLSSWALGRGASDGKFLRWWASVLQSGFGIGAPLVPVIVALAAIRAFARNGEPVLLFRHYVGGVLFFAGALGLLALGGGTDAGGVFGVVAGDIPRGVMGGAASGLVLLVCGWVAIFLLADTDVQTLERDLRRLAPRRTKKPSANADAPVKPAKPAERTKTARKTASLPLDATPAARVINLPTRSAKLDESQTTGPLPSPVPMEAGEPLPLPDVRVLPYYDAVTPDPGGLEQKAK